MFVHSEANDSCRTPRNWCADHFAEFWGFARLRPPPLLRWLHDPELRSDTGRQLNRGEHRQSLGRWLFFANQGEFREGDYEEIMNKASCLSLISNAVLVWNTLQIQKIVEELRAGGQQVKDEDLARVSPLLRAHVIPNGSYDLSIH